MSKKFYHPLMSNNITKDDINKVIYFLKKNPILTQNKNVEKFEKTWSSWLGVKYSVFVNSGSSANYITLAAYKNLFHNKGDIIVPTLTWPSDIMAVINNGFNPIFTDIKLENLSMDLNYIKKIITKKTKAIFITHAQGFNGLNKDFLTFCKNKKIDLIEDVCESHGATFNKKKLGTFGIVSNFSFYYAHHLSTIEGGMICTNNKDIYDFCVRFRGHGMLRESKFKNIIKKSKNYPDLNQKFIFLNPGFNFRNNEIGAIIGLNQVKRLNAAIKKRNKNFAYFIKNLDREKYFVDYDQNGISNYAFPIILNFRNFKNRNHFERILDKNQIEYRRGNAGGGNQIRQPYLKKGIFHKNPKNFPKTEILHHFGYYIGNYPDMNMDKIKRIIKIINNIKFFK